MVCDEDVFYLYERNRFTTKKVCEFYIREKIVQPITIGETCIPCKLSKKCYIYPGEECAICLDNILLKKDAYLTGCGHAFHRTCLFKTFETKWSLKPFSTLKCPICRCGLGLPILMTRYHNSMRMNHKHDFMDQLENFWITKDFIIPHYCDNIQKSHYLGMNKACSKCRRYQQFG